MTGLLDEAPVCSRQNQGGLFLVIGGPDRGARVRIIDQPISFGSSSKCTLVLTDSTVSRRHLEVSIVDGEFIVSDCDSTNGVTIAGRRFERAPIGFGDQIKIGRTVIKLVPDEEFVEPEPASAGAFGSLVGGDSRMRQLFTLLQEAAPTNATVLIEGDTGTGKELIAAEVHAHSARRHGPFITFDCGSVPRDLIASILFGHVKGAYTGALTDRRGVFAEAHGGTLFLDEIGELALELQPALLRALDTRSVCRVGATTYEKFDVRIVAATNRDLRAEVAKKRFREDLYYRLAVIRMSVPALYERGRDIPLLVEHFRTIYGPELAIAPEDLARLVAYRWPGNVRELRNVMERACVLGRDGRINLESALGDISAPTGLHVRRDLPFKDAKHQVVEAFERDYIDDLMQRHDGNLSAAAREAQIDRKHLRELLRKYQGVHFPAVTG
ncbi:MAG TPA: sigma 54-interacting transcriptional regulator [Kofleriaceae bacterium]